MGKGDRRTKRGKINIGSFGNVRAKASKSIGSTTSAQAKAKREKRPLTKKKR